MFLLAWAIAHYSPKSPQCLYRQLCLSKHIYSYNNIHDSFHHKRKRYSRDLDQRFDIFASHLSLIWLHNIYRPKDIWLYLEIYSRIFYCQVFFPTTGYTPERIGDLLRHDKLNPSYKDSLYIPVLCRHNMAVLGAFRHHADAGTFIRSSAVVGSFKAQQL